MRMTRNIVGIAVVLVFCGSFLNAQTATSASSEPTAVPAPAAYCVSTGGEVEMRFPVYGTNGSPQDWLTLSGRQGFCQYTSSSDGSRIHVAMDTLFTTKPSLAALAYYAQTTWNGQGEGNPASLYCTQLGGSDLFGGINAAGGGWVKLRTTDVVLEACIFPDNSTIDSWGLLYHSVGIIRGADLSTILKYPNPYPKTKAKSGSK
jgi:putative hemolysin